MHKPEEEPLTPQEEAELQAEIDLAMKAYEGKAPPALLAQMREKLEEGLRSHPVPRSLLRRFAARPDVDRSGNVARHPEDDEDAGEKEGA